MPIINRTLDASQQKEVIQNNFTIGAGGVTAIVNTSTLVIGIVPYPANIIGAQMYCAGISGAPSIALYVNRFIAGTGFTSIIIGTGTSNLLAAYGTSGPGSFGTSLFGSSGMVLAAQGSTIMQCLANDLLVAYQAGGTGSATTMTGVAVVIQPIMDVKYRFGTGV